MKLKEKQKQDKIERLGEIRVMNCGMRAEIIEYRGCKDIDIKFEDGYIITNKTYHHFKVGDIDNPNTHRVYGIGLYDKKYIKKDTYVKWQMMLRRCYSKEYLEKRPSYIGCEVCEEWKIYSNFEKWYIENHYQIEGEQMALDKDILIKGNKVYSPNTCIFVPFSINSLFVKNDRSRTSLPIGVTKNKKCINDRYVAKLKRKDKLINLGSYSTPEKAFNAYKIAKEELIKHVADKYKDKIPQKLYNAMYNYKVEITD